MSRYTIPHETWTIVVGWYDALETFFVRVTLPPQDAGQGETEVLWVGTEPHALTTVASVRQSVAPYTALPEAIAAQLQRDRDGRPARRVPLPRRLPSPLWEI